MNIFGFMLRITRDIWSNIKAVIMDSGFCLFKGILEIIKRDGLWECYDFKKGAIGLGGFVETELMSTSIFKMAVRDVLVLNGMRHSLMCLL